MISPIFGITKRETIITITPITAKRIEFTAGFTFSSLPPERMSMTPHQMINNTAINPDTSTTRAIPTLTISVSSYDWLMRSGPLANAISNIKGKFTERVPSDAQK